MRVGLAKQLERCLARLTKGRREDHSVLAQVLADMSAKQRRELTRKMVEEIDRRKKAKVMG